MGRAEAGSTKWVSNQMKAKGLTRLRWYCQICERALRDENAYKMHVQSESHVRKMLVVGEDPKKAINEFSDQFSKAFLQLLKTAHGEKAININHFYQEYIADRHHIHMNATKWPSLTEYAKYLGREGICRVEETDKGLTIAWIDNSPEAIRRQEQLRRKEAQDKGDEELEQRMLKEQIKRAEAAAAARGMNNEEEERLEDRELKRQEGETIKLSLFSKPAKTDETPKNEGKQEDERDSPAASSPETLGGKSNTEEAQSLEAKPKDSASFGGGVSLKMVAKPQPKNVFKQVKKNALAGGTKKNMVQQPQKMSEAERIMREEMDRKRARESSGFGGPSKKPRTEFGR